MSEIDNVGFFEQLRGIKKPDVFYHERVGETSWRLLTMEELKKKVFYNSICSTPVTLLMTTGLSLLLLSWGLGFAGILPIVGFSAVLGSIGFCANDLIFNYSARIEAAAKKIKEDQVQNQKNKLTELKSKLEYNDTEGWGLLTAICNTYEMFQRDIVQAKASRFITSEMVEQAEMLFNTTVSYIDDAYKMLVDSKLARGEAKTLLIKDRKRLIEEIKKGVDQFAEHVQAFKDMNAQPKKDGMSKLAEDLNNQLEIARKTEIEFRKLQGDQPKVYDY